MSEHAEQCALLDWARMQTWRQPELRLLFHIPNGGSRNAITGAQLKAAGVKAGVPDLCLPVARGGHHGLFIELKVGRNRPAEQQAAWLDALTAEGYLAVACWGWWDAKEVIEEYLGLEPFLAGSVPALVEQGGKHQHDQAEKDQQ